mmetsp:Transcript_25699/g.40060  ORF Transcript_25699/g.40060 Transcript_25699/m.40060 type:complete len:218 (-) Transcript_25699:7-660(-)
MGLLAISHTVSAVDQPPGKFDVNSLSQQTLMELLIQDVYDKEPLCIDDEDPKDIRRWHGVTLNVKEEVVRIVWRGFDISLSGTLDFRKLPPTVENVQVQRTDLEGTLDCSMLPQSIVIFGIQSNRFSGELDLTCLPKQLEHFCVQSNDFGGTLDLSSLPETLRRLDLSLNQSVGWTNFDMLPDAQVELNVVFTQLSGTVTPKNGRKIDNYKSRVRII